MKHTYLEEDLELIQRYFPGAKAVALRTPFDLTPRSRRLARLSTERFHDNEGPRGGGWQGGILWMS
jgi:hypothetical protein